MKLKKNETTEAAEHFETWEGDGGGGGSHLSLIFHFAIFTMSCVSLIDL